MHNDHKLRHLTPDDLFKLAKWVQNEQQVGRSGKTDERVVRKSDQTLHQYSDSLNVALISARNAGNTYVTGEFFHDGSRCMVVTGAEIVRFEQRRERIAAINKRLPDLADGQIDALLRLVDAAATTASAADVALAVAALLGAEEPQAPAPGGAS